MDFFQYDKVNDIIEIDDVGLILTKEFNALLDLKRNITKLDKTGKQKTLAFKEFKYIYLFFDWKSPYFSILEQDRHKEAMLDSGLTKEEFDNPLFREACRKYDEIQESNLSLQLLKAAQDATQELIHHLKTINLMERNEDTGVPIFKSKDLMSDLKNCKDVLVTLKELANQVKKDLDVSSGLRGDVEEGMFD